MTKLRCRAMLVLATLAVFTTLSAQTMVLIPMDLTQTDHLKAYGVVYRLLERAQKVEWLLNYRGGSFLFPPEQQAVKECKLNGVAYLAVGPDEVVQVRSTIEKNNRRRLSMRSGGSSPESDD